MSTTSTHDKTTVDQEAHRSIDLEKQPKNTGGDKFFESNAGDGTTVFDQYLTGIPLYLCFASCFISLFLIGLDQTIVITLLEDVGSKFNAYDKIGWIASGYMLTMAVFAQTWGKFSIIFGRKYSLLSAIILFEAGSLMCALANDMNVLIGGRILAGIGGGGIQTLVFIVGTEMVSIDKRSLAFAFFGVSFSISTIVGPLIGGGFTEHVTWRWFDFPVLTLFCVFFCFMSLIVFLSTYFQVVQGSGPLSTGIQFFPMIIALVISSISTGILIKKTRYIKPFAMFGAVIGAIGCGLMTLLEVDSNRGQKIGYLILPGASIGILLQTSIMSSQLEAPKIAGSTILTTALFNFARSLGGAIGADLAQAIFNSSVKNKLKQAVSNHPSAFSGVSMSEITGALNRPDLLRSLPSETTQAILRAIMGAIRNVFYTATAVSCLTVVFVVCFSNRRVPAAEHVMKRAEDDDKREEANEQDEQEDQQEEDKPQQV
ncbi:Vacuolar basic amino acid transporter 5 [Cyberlindnera fabianii]|uniref:Vacuolar basic amino acid transporter 5 n=1 Tax=Cyberlindnera fabianii TaxID=36022 RepID=A0A1V2L162_CYBFA|nr:Vacuolar basic amino acid transporter 5 [Cyberlindnera fabianii]